MGDMQAKRVAVIGAGNMGGALVAGMVKSGLLPPDRITAIDISEAVLEEHRQKLGVNTSGEAGEVVGDQDVVVLGLKPQVWQHVVAGFSGSLTSAQLVLSIMGGVRTSAIEQTLGKGVAVVRAMPNILAQIREAISAVCPGQYAGEAHLLVAREILGAVGETVVVDEAQMDAVTGLSGSGPAYVYAMIDALAEGGVKVGLSKEVALKLAAQTVLGAAKAVLESGEHPAVLKDRVTSAGGTTIAGLYAMEQSGFRAALMAAVEAATRRSEALGA